MTETKASDEIEASDEVDVEGIEAGLPPVSEEEFAEMLGDVAGWDVPRVFAVYEVAPGRVDARAFGWGMAFESRAFFVGCLDARPTYVSLTSPDDVVRIFGRRRELRLLWPTPDPDRSTEAPWPPDEPHRSAAD